MVEVWDSGLGTAQENMDRDKKILETLTSPLLHHYDWQGPCATYGYFLKPEKVLNLERAQALQFSLGRRPTGGGVIFHLTDLAFSLFLPADHPQFSVNTLENYRFVNEMVIEAVGGFSPHLQGGELLKEEVSPLHPSCACFCMAKPTKYDVMVGGKKVGGAAQRRTKKGFLHQGTLALAPLPLDQIAQILPEGSPVREGMFQTTLTLVDEELTPAQLHSLRQELRQVLSKVVKERFASF